MTAALVARVGSIDEGYRPQPLSGIRTRSESRDANPRRCALECGLLLARRVPGFPHEILVDIVRKGGEVVRELLLACTNINPGDGTAEEATIDLSQVVPIEYRADNVTLF